MLTIGPIYQSDAINNQYQQNLSFYVLTPEAPMPWKALAMINHIMDYIIGISMDASTQPQCLTHSPVQHRKEMIQGQMWKG